MRHPDADAIRRRCRARLDEVLDAVGVTTRTVESDSDGWVNVCFLTDEVVVRFNARDPNLPKFRREEACYRRLGDAGIPVPRVVARFDADRFGVPVLVTERLPGANLEQTWDDLSDERRRLLARDAGRWLGMIHQLRFDEFGEPHAAESDDWPGCVREIGDRFLADCAELRLLSDVEVDRFATAISAAIDRLPGVSPRLVHRDYHLGNLLHDGERITGILDFEWSLIGDRRWDLIGVESMDETWPGSARPFHAGYHDEIGWPDEAELQFALYRCLGNLELCAVAERFLSDAESDEYVATTLRQLERFEQVL